MVFEIGLKRSRREEKCSLSLLKTGFAAVHFNGKLIDGVIAEFNQSFLVTHADD